ncbi:MAG: Bro-N domain-containing protein [Acidovorax sp.]|uniref:BRO-N domain-containing protein n=1 Tax=Acidovorax sp. TaxID=1872122 RepID=UPI0026161D26|nr:Bro-N domain-containing protein [Acidovorax sp.]MDH4463121.1 Bro-N domain-containing protein [Acidovorax sp.]
METQNTTTQSPGALDAAVFNHQGGSHAVRSTRDHEGNTWWVARDVCEALGITKQARALERVNKADRGGTKLGTPGGIQTFVTINQSGLYALAFQSRKPAAVAFQHWVTSEVLPALSRDGVYVRGEEALRGCATAAEVDTARAQITETATRGIEAKAQRGLSAVEELEARSAGFAVLKSGGKRRTRGKRISSRGKVSI